MSDFYCGACKKWLPTSESASARTCVKCKAASHAWYLANRKRSIVAAARWKRENPDRAKEILQAWVENNPERRRQILRDWRVNNPERQLEQARAYVERRRARLLNATVEVFTIPELRQYWVDNGIDPDACAYCGGLHEHDDHVIPLARGGAHERANLLPSCAACNGSKATKLLEEWQPERFAA